MDRPRSTNWCTAPIRSSTGQNAPAGIKWRSRIRLTTRRNADDRCAARRVIHSRQTTRPLRALQESMSQVVALPSVQPAPLPLQLQQIVPLSDVVAANRQRDALYLLSEQLHRAST